jgi:hypothetical protein
MWIKKFLIWVALCFALPPLATQAQDGSGAITLFNNVRVFDGRSPALSGPSNVLIRGNIIARIQPNRSPSIAGPTRASSTAVAGP